MILKAENLKKRYGSFELDIDHLTIRDKEIFGIVGNNGAGKTTFLRLSLDLIKSDNGHFFSGNINVSKEEDWKKYTGSYLDEGFLIDFLTPEEYFAFVASLHDMSEKQIEKSLDRFDIFFNKGILGQKKYIRGMSTGNKQKIGIAASMFIEPQVLVLDEPFANLDPTSRKVLNNLLNELNKKNDTTMLISSHDLDNVVNVCTRIAILDNGKIVHDVQVSDKTYDELQEYFKLTPHQSCT
ncbi:ABC transporter ATP-binding protein [bacterium]|nr:ABC transporter ATP-binding protein [bacterium]